MQPNVTVTIKRRQPISVNLQRRTPIKAVIQKKQFNIAIVKNVIRVTAKLQGPPGPPGSGSGGGQWSSLKEPIESPDGVREVFSNNEGWVAGTLRVTLNGLLEPVTDLGSANFEFVDPPQLGDVIHLWYQKL